MKKALVVVLTMLLLVGCGNEWESKKVLNKTANMEEVYRQVPDPRWEYAWMCGTTISTRFECGFQYGYNARATKSQAFNEMVYRVELYVKYSDDTEETVTYQITEEEYNNYKVGETIYKGER